MFRLTDIQKAHAVISMYKGRKANKDANRALWEHLEDEEGSGTNEDLEADAKRKVGGTTH